MNKEIFIFSGFIIKEENGYSSLCLNVDVASQDDKINEAKTNLMEAIELYIESAIENNLPIIRSVPASENPQINRVNDIVEAYNQLSLYRGRAWTHTHLLAPDSELNGILLNFIPFYLIIVKIIN